MKKNLMAMLKKIGIGRLILLLGALSFLIWSGIASVPERENSSLAENEYRMTEQTALFSYEKELERRLKRILSGVTSDKEPEVMITVSDSGERILETTSEREEELLTESAEGENRKESRTMERTQALLLQKGSESIPFIKKELSPEIQGVLVCVRGPASQLEISEISEAVQALFGISAHRVKVIVKTYQVEE